MSRTADRTRTEYHRAPHIANANRVIEWARSQPRLAPQIAFADGPERQAAYWIEWAEAEAQRNRDTEPA